MSHIQILTSESVGEGHPDKLADQISDAILDETLNQDPDAKVAVETFVAHGFVVVSGELTSHNAYVDIAQLVRKTIHDVGYDSTDLGFDAAACGVLLAINEQAREIATGISHGGAGDQGMMYGYACTETPELMPIPISMAHAMTRQSAIERRAHPSLGFGPDVKSQISVQYDDDKPVSLDTVVVSQQHTEENKEEIHQLALEKIINPVLSNYEQIDCSDFKSFINPSGSFIVGGPKADTGLTGRKIIVDTYGGLCPHGGGAFSGKDATKVDRSAAYMARHVAKCVVAAGLASRCQLALAYAIGVEQPVAINLETFGTETIDKAMIDKKVRETFDLSPRGIIKHLGLTRPIFLQTAKNGHFGNPTFPWEDTSPAESLK